MKCHCCGKNESEDLCDRCGEPVCHDCCVKFTIHNQIDFPLCVDCEETNNEIKYEIDKAEQEKQKIKDNIKKEKSEYRRKMYRTPEAIEKRRLKRIELIRKRNEIRKERAEKLAKIMIGMFK